ncbi:LysR family transcriptional regulator [Dyella sp. LX-66]|uniref:LysR family transcriptional regulator n=1 Tax=unclassified Dyella TaxID=2634549 RepID=UPI001BE0CD56|nr:MULTISPECIES: LysR family transcriptional regulator [unclassified Dyella]MBT2118363.1 LysR family transcriptional regulator [Dyella sp. LX-1]MBT2140246.1 LysR family transcriptional regulator [Dyella sp. LX-66]
MIDLNELQYFVQVAQARSFTAAGAHFGVPKSSVSRAIAALEQRLGVRLIERTTRSMALTEAGEIYLERCRRVVEEAELADLSIGSMQAAPRGRLRIGAPIAFARFMLGPRLAEFSRRWPELRVQLQITAGESTPQQANLDVLIRPGPLEDSSLLARPLATIRLGLYASPAYLKGRKAPKTPADLSQLDALITACGPLGQPAEQTMWRLHRGKEVQEVRVEARLSVPDPTINHQLALDGAGVAILAQHGAAQALAKKQLVRVLPAWEPEPVELFALYPARLNASPKVRALLEFLRG